MKDKNPADEIEELLDEWNRSILDKDVAVAAKLREDGYSAVMPDGSILSREEELAMIASPGHTITSIRRQNLKVQALGNKATAVFENVIEGEYLGEDINALYRFTISFAKSDEIWRARSSHLEADETAGRRPSDGTVRELSTRVQASSGSGPGETFRLRRLVSKPIRSWLRGKIKSVASESAPSFQALSYIPYKPGVNFVIPANRVNDADAGSSELPIPPKELWLGYNYPVHGKAHVSKMLEIVYASKFEFKVNDRILDFGCGAGRMIRHLKDLSEICEVWGTDISAEHIYWCKQHLSPPFNFATTTKVPHLPFEDRSLQLIYCASVFTHIDDLADAWLLELKRILAPGGRLYLTIHDNHTIKLFEEGRYESTEIIRQLRLQEIYQQSKDSFGMFTVGRDDGSQVFYDIDYFSKNLRPIFDIISVTQEAYFYQTALLLKRKS